MRKVTDIRLILIQHVHKLLLSETVPVNFSQDRFQNGGLDLQRRGFRPGESWVVLNVARRYVTWSLIFDHFG